MEESKQVRKDKPQIESKDRVTPTFFRQEHIKYLLGLDETQDIDSIGFYLTQHLRVAGGYWTLYSLACLGVQIPKQKREDLIKWLQTCQNSDGGFGGNTGHDSHMTSTHYAVLIIILFDALGEFDMEKLVTYVSSLQQPEDGSFQGDVWGEVDTRFTYCALSCLTLLNKTDKINVKQACQFVLSCRNFDGSFGGQPDAESHGAYVFTATGALQIGGYIDSIEKDDLGYWLSERQTIKGGFNGRPEKLADVCYSWWIYSSFQIINREEWIDQGALQQFILECQDFEGGIGDRPGNVVDVFHTFFGIAALSLLDEKTNKYKLSPIDPVFALPRSLLLEKFPHVKHLLVL